MSNPTSNFNWQMPTASDLVTDLPADFEVFGQAVDTSLADLKGGTTGQVLKKNSNTDMDFVWGADSAGMTNPMTTTGDIIYSSSGSTPARLGIGTSGQVIGIAAGVPAWTTPAVAGYTQVASGTLSGSSVTISSLTGNDMILVIFGASSATGNVDLRMRMNGDTGSNYYTSGSSDTAVTFIKVTNQLYEATTTFQAYTLPGAGSGAQVKAIQSPISGTGGVWKSTAAITSLTIFPEAYTFDAGNYYVWSK